MTQQLKDAVDELLVLGTDDFVTTWDLAGVAASKMGALTPSEIRDRSLAILREAVDAGFVEIGEVQDGFKPWQLDPGQAVAQVAKLWESDADDTPFIGTFWLRNTDKGTERGRRVLAAEKG